MQFSAVGFADLGELFNQCRQVSWYVAGSKLEMLDVEVYAFRAGAYAKVTDQTSFMLGTFPEGVRKHLWIDLLVSCILFALGQTHVLRNIESKEETGLDGSEKRVILHLKRREQ